MKKVNCTSGMNTSKALKAARDLGCAVESVRRTGEKVVIAPDGERVRFSGERKDAPRALTTLLHRLTTAAQRRRAVVVTGTRRSGWGRAPVVTKSVGRKKLAATA
jgi:hypothetical protein